MAEKINLSDGEWKIMQKLWEKSPQRLSELVESFQEETAWSKGTIFMMLKRMKEKGAVRQEKEGRGSLFHARASKAESIRTETKFFLEKVYGGSLSLFISHMAGQDALEEEEIDALYALLKKAKEAKDDD